MQRAIFNVAAIIAAITIGATSTAYAASNGYTITPGDSLGVHCATYLNIVRRDNNAAYLTCDAGNQEPTHVIDGPSNNNTQPTINHSTDSSNKECRKDRKGRCKD